MTNKKSKQTSLLFLLVAHLAGPWQWQNPYN
ncbi:hypothetical protein EAb13_CDS0123 [Acinetobacter phage EAb13]|nr:hypothetical protein EAb13_CDS0005 [Acinetobacter phage EAb13]WGH24541.1 hypothetical protein EAb13_CDS0123 [Acinetobacter phage EAb13]